MKKILQSGICIIFVLICLTGCSYEKEEKTIQDKTNQEISYVEDAIFLIANKYVKGEYQTDNGLNWDAIFNDEKKINDVLDSILLDLSELKIGNDHLVSFSNTLNQLIITTSNKNETDFMIRLSNLYALLPQYMNQYSDNKNEVKKKEIKSIVLSSYSLANASNWTEAKTMIQSAEDNYNGMMNDVDYMQQNSYHLNRIYVLIEELKNATNLENIDLMKAKYLAIIEKI